MDCWRRGRDEVTFLYIFIYINQFFSGFFRLSDLNECTRETSFCNELATCTNKRGSYSCKCNSGFEGNGFDCYMYCYAGKCYNMVFNLRCICQKFIYLKYITRFEQHTPEAGHLFKRLQLGLITRMQGNSMEGKEMASLYKLYLTLASALK